MMTKKLAVAAILGTMLLAPTLVIAEESSAGGADIAPQPALYRESPSRPSTGKLNGLPPGEPILGGKIHSASGTKELPKGLEMREKSMNRPTSTELGKERGKEMRVQMADKRGEIMKRMIEQQIGRMKAMIDRLAKLADRLESRIAKLKERGVDTTKTEVILADARVKLDSARTAVKEAEQGAKDILAGAATDSMVNGSSTTAHAELGKSVRGALAGAREAVKAAHKALVEAIASLNASGKPKPEKPTTSTNATGTNTQ